MSNLRLDFVPVHPEISQNSMERMFSIILLVFFASQHCKVCLLKCQPSKCENGTSKHEAIPFSFLPLHFGPKLWTTTLVLVVNCPKAFCRLVIRARRNLAICSVHSKMVTMGSAPRVKDGSICRILCSSGIEPGALSLLPSPLPCKHCIGDSAVHDICGV